MNRWIAFLFSALLLPCAAHADLAPTPIELPAVFKVKRTKTLAPVVFMHSTGEYRNPFDRKWTESQCAASRQLGLTHKHPVFEPGFDQPLKNEDYWFADANRSASFHIEEGYGCSTPPTPDISSVDYLCGCTYRMATGVTLRIKKKRGATIERLQANLSAGTGERSRRPDRSAPPDPGREAAIVKAMAPEVIGREVIAGIPCVMRRQRLSNQDKAWTDFCIAEDEDKKLPALLRFKALSGSTPASDGRGTYGWSKADRIIENAYVDEGVFDLPDGLVVKESK